MAVFDFEADLADEVGPGGRVEERVGESADTVSLGVHGFGANTSRDVDDDGPGSGQRRRQVRLKGYALARGPLELDPSYAIARVVQSVRMAHAARAPLDHEACGSLTRGADRSLECLPRGDPVPARTPDKTLLGIGGAGGIVVKRPSRSDSPTQHGLWRAVRPTVRRVQTARELLNQHHAVEYRGLGKRGLPLTGTLRYRGNRLIHFPGQAGLVQDSGDHPGRPPGARTGRTALASR
ncbi:hypothetical protein GCM10010129_40960 [Streptomyces fumigatiscleroticus]|nr:hypothetical protein GCM10010129_40960 [Streptomyces fumigatiscleroticus]